VDASAVPDVVHRLAGLILERSQVQDRDYRPLASGAKAFVAVAMNSVPRRSAVRLVAACQLADDSLAPVRLVAGEPSAVLGARQSLEAVVSVQLLDP
jgi:hypothetical protein